MSSIKDVARRAGVAVSTVSKALNGYPNVSEETRVRVNAAVRELNFTPNLLASALSSKKIPGQTTEPPPSPETSGTDRPEIVKKANKIRAFKTNGSYCRQ